MKIDDDKNSILSEDNDKKSFKDKFNTFLNHSSKLGIEVRGIQPIDDNERTYGIGALINMCTIWLSPNATVLTVSTGGLGPSSFAMSARDSCLTILFFNLLGNLLPAYLGTFGPKLGMRQMTIARYSFGYYPVFFACLLNFVGMIGFCSLNAASGGQVLSAVSNGSLSSSVGIVIIAVIALFVSFMGFKIIHSFERYAWIVMTIMFIFVAGCAGKHLSVIHEVPFEPATAGAVLSFGAVVLGYGMTWAPLASDYSAYLPSDVKSWKVFTLMYIGLNLPLILLQCLGAILQVGTMAIPSWSDGYDSLGLGGQLDAILMPLHGFRKFVLVVLALGICTNNAPTIYSCSLTLQTILPFLVYIPRFILSTCATGIYLPIAIVVATKFQTALNNFLSCLGYWTSLYGSILICDHLVFKRLNWFNYDYNAWNNPRLLPPGIAALLAGLVGCAIVVISMSQVWWVGPLATKINGGGDIATELGFVVSGICYIPFRLIEYHIEKKFRKV